MTKNDCIYFWKIKTQTTSQICARNRCSRSLQAIWLKHPSRWTSSARSRCSHWPYTSRSEDPKGRKPRLAWMSTSWIRSSLSQMIHTYGLMRSSSSFKSPTSSSRRRPMPLRSRSSSSIVRRFWSRKSSNKWFTNSRKWQQMCSICLMWYWRWHFSTLRPKNSSNISWYAHALARTLMFPTCEKKYA